MEEVRFEFEDSGTFSGSGMGVLHKRWGWDLVDVEIAGIHWGHPSRKIDVGSWQKFGECIRFGKT